MNLRTKAFKKIKVVIITVLVRIAVSIEHLYTINRINSNTGRATLEGTNLFSFSKR
jgi:hypothetical protein